MATGDTHDPREIEALRAKAEQKIAAGIATASSRLIELGIVRDAGKDSIARYLTDIDPELLEKLRANDLGAFFNEVLNYSLVDLAPKPEEDAVEKNLDEVFMKLEQPTIYEDEEYRMLENSDEVVLRDRIVEFRLDALVYRDYRPVNLLTGATKGAASTLAFEALKLGLEIPQSARKHLTDDQIGDVTVRYQGYKQVDTTPFLDPAEQTETLESIFDGTAARAAADQRAKLEKFIALFPDLNKFAEQVLNCTSDGTLKI